MTNTFQMPNFSAQELPDKVSAEEAAANRFTEGVLAKHKREGLELAVRARWIALSVTGVMLLFIAPFPSVLYYEVMLILVAGVGWLQQRVGRVGRSRAELAVLALDLTLMTIILVAPNPFFNEKSPTAFIYRFDNFDYLYIILAVGTLGYSWRTIGAIGVWTASLWLIGVGIVWWFGITYPELTIAAETAFAGFPVIIDEMDPNSLRMDVRLQQVVVFVLVAFTLSMSIRRFNRLLLSNASLERERENLSRYFSPSMVEELSRNDEPLKQIRQHDVAVIFVDIQGFTTYASQRPAEEVIQTLRSFQSFMERAVFAQNGTLDKYLGDGLMATFGTPFPKPDDVRRAYHCARQMVLAAEAWNAARVSAGDTPLGVGVGLHYGPAVLGDIGGNRLEFAVIGNTVNIASRMEDLTRPLSCKLVVSDAVHCALPHEETIDLDLVPNQAIRGIDGTVQVWALR